VEEESKFEGVEVVKIAGETPMARRELYLFLDPK
jgi:hypothetical protein